MEEACTSSVVNLSVSEMYDLCGQPVAVDLVNNKTICGNIFTFDPITHSVVIIVFACTKGMLLNIGRLNQIKIIRF